MQNDEIWLLRHHKTNSAFSIFIFSILSLNKEKKVSFLKTLVRQIDQRLNERQGTWSKLFGISLLDWHVDILTFIWHIKNVNVIGLEMLTLYQIENCKVMTTKMTEHKQR